MRPSTLAKINLSIDAALWLAFHEACSARKTSASKEVTRFMHKQLDLWEHENHGEPDPDPS